jgi:hypothetical protein
MVAGLALPERVVAFTWPGAVVSWYMDTVNTTTLYNMGCTQGDLRENGSAPQDALFILDFGQPSWDSQTGYGAWAFGIGYVTTSQIRSAVLEFAHGFWFCTGGNITAHATIAVGTTNFANWSKNAQFTDAMVEAHARAWALMVNAINDDIAARSYQRQTSSVAAADIEVSWGGPVTARRWIDQYSTLNHWAIYNFGDAAGCITSGTVQTAAQCGSSPWYQNDLYYVGWGAPPAWAVPEIYLENGVQAKQWQQISKWATLNGKTRIQFAGSLTQHGACSQPGHNCTGTNNTAAEGWTQLVNECARDSATSLTTVRFSTDIKWH